MNQKRGFVTVATGEYYYWLAENLIMSYKLFSENKYPMYVMTDSAGAERLAKVFDGVIVLDEPHYSFLDKILVYENTVFEETIFLDADMNIVDDITFLFDEFHTLGSEISCIGTLRTITDDTKPNHFGMKAIERFGLKQYISFGGGIYYFKKSSKAQQSIQFIFDELIPNYGKYELKYFGGDKMADEPLMELAMLQYNMRPLSTTNHIMRFAENMMDTIKWDMNNRKASFVWRDKEVFPTILHYATFNTYTKEYVYYNTLLRCKFKKVWNIIIPFYILKEEVRLFFRLAVNPRRRTAFYKWFFGHFTIEYVKLTCRRIMRRLGKR